MTFQIVRVSPVHHISTDAIIGSKGTALPMAYVSEALARKIAGRLSDDEYDGCGDDHFVVVPYGTSWTAWNNVALVARSAAAFDDMPF